MQVSWEQVNGTAVCRLEGELDVLSVPEFRRALSVIGPGCRVVFDLQAVGFIDSAGLGALIGGVRRARELHGDAVVCRARASVSRVFNMVGLHRIVHLADDRAEAVRYLLAGGLAAGRELRHQSRPDRSVRVAG